MRGYPKGQMSKRDFENLRTMPHHAKKANEDLKKLAAIDDRKITVDRGTQDVPNLVQIDNPFPRWKRHGFKDKADLVNYSNIVW